MNPISTSQSFIITVNWQERKNIFVNITQITYKTNISNRLVAIDGYLCLIL